MDIRLVTGLIGSLVLVSGAATQNQRRKNMLFAAGNACMFTYALLGYLQGGPVFFLILQLFIAVSTVSMLLHIPDKYDTPLLAVTGLGLVGWALMYFEDYTTIIFVGGLMLLGIGYAMNAGTIKRETALMTGSLGIAIFSYLARDWIFLFLNALFAMFAARNILLIRRVSRGVHSTDPEIH